MAEIFAIIACVAAVTSAFRDGSDVVRRIKEKRQARKAPPPTRFLEESLDKGPRDIEAQRDEGIERFGDAFKVGDEIARTALLQITVDLQGTLLRQLRQACDNDNMTDFSVVIDASDRGRKRAVGTLCELYMRMLQRGEIMDISQHTRPEPVRLDTSAGKQGSESGRRNHDKRISLWERLRRRDSVTATRMPIATATQPTQSHTTETTEAPQSSQGDTAQRQSPVLQIEYDWLPGEEDPARIWRRDSLETTPEDADLSRHTWLSDTSTGLRPQISPLSPPQAQSASLTFITPTASNHYLGFCKGAWMAQSGASDALVQRQNMSNPWGSNSVYYLACSSSKCAFTSGLAQDRIWTNALQGVKFRWAFLTKSHVSQPKVKQKKHRYLCMLCALQGRGLGGPNGRVFEGTEELVQHLSKHRGEPFTQVVLTRAGCINDHVAGDEEDFDVNLFPL